MGYLIMYDKVTGLPKEIWGDDRDINNARRDLGLPYRKPTGQYVSDATDKAIAEAGE